MKTSILTTLLLIITVQVFSQAKRTEWSEELRLKQLENIKNPALWDLTRMKKDIRKTDSLVPIRFGAFPVPHYDSLAMKSYRGGGVECPYVLPSIPEFRLQVAGKEIAYCSFFVGNSTFYPSNDQASTIFFTVITVVDTLNTDNHIIGNSQFISRNHPDMVGQGSFLIKNNRVDFLGFITPEEHNIALVNMRLFHLNYGNTIIITPQKDGSFKSMQINGKTASKDDSENYEYIKNNVLKRKQVIAFLTEDGVI